MEEHCFHEVVVEGKTFRAVMSGDGPYLECGHTGVALGACSIVFIETPFVKSWWLAKYGTQRRIKLDGFTSEGRERLSREFGIPIGSVPLDRTECEAFFESPAFASLCQWVSRYPRIAQHFGRCQVYLRGWYWRALAKVAEKPGVCLTHSQNP